MNDVIYEPPSGDKEDRSSPFGGAKAQPYQRPVDEDPFVQELLDYMLKPVEDPDGPCHEAFIIKVTPERITEYRKELSRAFLVPDPLLRSELFR